MADGLACSGRQFKATQSMDEVSRLSAFWPSLHLLPHRFSQSVRRPGVPRVCSFVVSGSFLPHLVPVGAPSPRRPWPPPSTVREECWVAVDLPWRAPQPLCVAKPVAVFLSTLQFATLTLVSPTEGMSACRCSMECSLQSTFVSVQRRDGTPHPRCANEDGAALAQTHRRKELRHPELAPHHGCAELVVLAIEVGGRCSKECRQFFCQLAQPRLGMSRRSCGPCCSARAHRSFHSRRGLGGQFWFFLGVSW